MLRTGFERFGAHAMNPTERLARDLERRVLGAWEIRTAVLPVHRADGPAAYLGTLPCSAMHAALASGGIAACLSTPAGTYLCNQVFYTTLHVVR